MSSGEDDGKGGSRRRPRRKNSASEDEPEEDAAAPAAPEAPKAPAAPQVDKSGMGKALGAFDEARRKKLQTAVVEAMFVLAEKKYNKKRPVRETDARDAMADFDLYLRSIKAKVKTAEDKLNGLLKQKKELDAKMDAAQKEHDSRKKEADDGDIEKATAVKDSRDPVLPKGFIIPKKLGAAKVNLSASLLKASSGAWEDKFAAKMAAKKGGAGGNPAWKKKTDRTSVLMGPGASKKKDRNAPAEPAFALKKAAPKK